LKTSEKVKFLLWQIVHLLRTALHTSLSLFISIGREIQKCLGFSIKQQLSANEMILLYGENADNQCNGSYSYADDEVNFLYSLFIRQCLISKSGCVD
jgi:hypothetical protein